MKISTCIFALSGALFLTGCAARLPEEELHLARERLDKCLDNVSSQSEMNLISTFSRVSVALTFPFSPSSNK